jgi:aspartate-semialdehyde dehydrogenase
VRVAVVGATGLVGREMLSILAQRGLAGPDRVMAFASSGGREVGFGEASIPVGVLDPSSVGRGDYLLGATSSAVARRWVEACAAAGAVVVDNSSAFRMRDDVPLIVPEVNPDAIGSHQGIIANPNCSTIQLVTALAPIAREVAIDWVSVSTCQAVSGAGRRELDRLRAQSSGRADGEPSYHGNVLTEIGEPGPEGYCGEELKLMRETVKIMDARFEVFPACARVGVEVGHTESVSVMLREPLGAADARELLRRGSGLTVSEKGFSPLAVAGSDTVGVGRVRNHPAEPRMLQFWVTADNLRKGAALNAVQILELLLR